MGRHVHYSGLVVAGIGFFLTRFTVTLALYEEPVRFYLAGVVPLVLGLGLAAFGVALTVADVDRSLVRTTAVWCTLGTGGMLVLVALTLLGSADGLADVGTVRSQTYFSTFLIGGSVGGTFTGLYAARSKHHRTALQRQTNRLVVLNRLLRHEVLNALTAIRGFGTASEDHDRAGQVIADRTDDIEQTIQEVSYLTSHAGQGDVGGAPVDLAACLTDSIESVEARYPSVTIEHASVPDGVAVYANERLSHVFTQLLENAVVHANDERPAVDVTVTDDTVRISVSDTGTGLPSSQQRLLETGDIEEFDDPRMGYGLNVVRLLVESYGGDIETDHGDEGTAVTVALSRATESRDSGSKLRTVRPGMPNLVVTLAASLLAGVVYGIVSEGFGGSIAGIGVFYGTADPVVGWLTHEFHSVVFGFVFASLVSLAPREQRDRIWTVVAVGLGWSLALWLGAAGVVAPVWLRLLGIPASLPSLSVPLLASHLAWGVSLALLTTLGDRILVPWFDDRSLSISPRRSSRRR